MKQSLHPRNRYQGYYNLPLLCQHIPELKQWIRSTPNGEQTLDFSAPRAVSLLNQALLKEYYQLNWTLDAAFLSPPVPGRADVIHYLADLLAQDNQSKIPSFINVLDVGCGANCIYPLIGNAEYGWRFTGSEISVKAIKSAQGIIESNEGLQRMIRLRRQHDVNQVFTKIIQRQEYYHLTLCNPPFHASLKEAERGTVRKNRNLKLSEATGLNFSGQEHELCCQGGELGFVSRMISESQQFANQVGWFSCLISRKQNIPPLRSQLIQVGVKEYRIIEMGQGNKQSRLLAWTYQPLLLRKKNYRLLKR